MILDLSGNNKNKIIWVIHGKRWHKEKTICGFKHRVMTNNKDEITCGSCLKILKGKINVHNKR